MADQKDPIGISEMIDRVKLELLQTRSFSQPLFKINQVELEISFTVERSADGGINFQVVRGDVQKTWSEVQTVKVTLDPIVPPGEIGQDLTPTEKEIAKRSLQRESDID